MNIVVVGAGAVGGYFGGKMVKAGIPITFFVREKRYKQLKENGLHIRSVHGDFSVHPKLVTNPKDVESPEIVFLAVKTYHLESTFSALDMWVGQGSKIVPLLNGVEGIDRLVERYDNNSVLGGLNYVESTLDAKGQIIQTSPMQEIVIGALSSENAAIAKRLFQTLHDCEFNVTLSENIKMDMWEKYLFLTVLSGMTATTRKPIGDILADKTTFQFLKNMLGELILLAHMEGISLPENIKDKILLRFKNVSKTMTSSMYRDLVQGLPMELESLHGYAVRLGEKHNIPVPCLRSVYTILYPYMQGHS